MLSLIYFIKQARLFIEFIISEDNSIATTIDLWQCIYGMEHVSHVVVIAQWSPLWFLLYILQCLQLWKMVKLQLDWHTVVSAQGKKKFNFEIAVTRWYSHHQALWHRSLPCGPRILVVYCIEISSDDWIGHMIRVYRGKLNSSELLIFTLQSHP
jgi:hypothetical protein